MAGGVLATMAEEEEDDEESRSRRQDRGEVEQVFGSLRYLYFGMEFPLCAVILSWLTSWENGAVYTLQADILA